MGARAPQTGNVRIVHPAQCQGGGTSSRRVRQLPGKRQRQRWQALFVSPCAPFHGACGACGACGAEPTVPEANVDAHLF